MAVVSGEALALLAILTLTPGADTFLVLRQSLAGGLRAAVPTIAGICTGVVVHASVAGAGLAVLLRQSPAAFRAVQAAGVGYLAYLGVRSLVAAARRHGPPPQPPAPRGALRDGLLTNLLNPKVSLFYLGFLPQFIPPGAPVLGLGVFYGLAHAAMGAAWLGAVALAAHALRDRIASPGFRRGAELVAGLALLGFALRLALP